MRAIEFWFEFGSPYSYPAAARAGAVCAAAGVELRWRPFLLGPLLRAQGYTDSPFNFYQLKGRYMWRDLERSCALLGLPWQRPSVFPRNGLLAARVACRFQDAPWLPAFATAVFRANFVDDHDIADPAVIGACLREAGQDPQALIDAAQHPDAKRQLRDQTERARTLGMFGAPNFRVGDELFWGNDRLEQALQWLDHARP